MLTVTVWLLVMVSHVNSGELGAVQPHMFPQLEDCMYVANNAPEFGIKWRCIKTRVLVR